MIPQLSFERCRTRDIVKIGKGLVELLLGEFYVGIFFFEQCEFV